MWRDSYEASCVPGQRISFFALGGEAHGVTTKGLKWDLNNATIGQNFYSISNECISKSLSITISEGSLHLLKYTNL